jgi:hypothetical protein
MAKWQARCLWNALGRQDFPVLDFSGRAKTASRGKNATRRIKGSKEGGCGYTEHDPGVQNENSG